ncbi:hypothetical protein [Castellaniella sp.]|uniref:hypothetical protein n=1 Tax=Castellaniella sp. TaxID=1955812 RepID=UPI003A8DF39D
MKNALFWIAIGLSAGSALVTIATGSGPHLIVAVIAGAVAFVMNHQLKDERQ